MPRTSRLYDHMTSRRGFLAWAGRSAAFAGFLAATRSLPAVAQDAPLLRIWMGEDYVPAWNAYLPVMIEKIAAEMGVRVEVELTPDNDTGRARRNTALEADTLPDIFSSTTADAARFYDLGKLHPVVLDVVQRMNDTNGGWVDGVTDFVRAKDGNIYAVPFFTRPWLFHYRMDLLEAAGFNAPPATLDELKEIAKAINNPGQGIYGTGMPYGQADMDGHMVAMPWLYNSAWQDAEGNLTVATPANLEALKSYLWFYQEGVTPPDSLTWGGVGNNDAYLTGLSAIVNNTPSLFAAIKRDRPDIAEVTSVGPWPKAIPDGQPAATTIGFCLNIAHNTPHAELAAEFVQRMLDLGNIGPLLEAGGGQAMPVRENLRSLDFLTADPIIARIAQEVSPYSRPVTWPGPNSAAYGELTSNSSTYFRDMMHRVLVDGMTPEQSLDLFAADAAVLTARYDQ